MEQLLSNFNTTDLIIAFLCVVIAAQQVGIYNLIGEVRRLAKDAGESASPRMQLMLSMMTPSQEMLQRGAVWFDEYVKSDNNPANDRYGDLARRFTGASQPADSEATDVTD